MESLVNETLQEAVNYNEKLIPAIDKTIDYFRIQKEDKGLKLFIPIVDGLRWNIDVIYHTKEWLNQNNIEINSGILKDHFREMTIALENQDYVLLTDLLEYEIRPILDTFQEQLKELLR